MDDENGSGAGPAGGLAGACPERRNVGTSVGTCVGPDQQGTLVGPAYQTYG